MTTPPNALDPRFLARLIELDEPPTGAEAGLSGPWKVARTAEGYAVLRDWEEPRLGDRPAGVMEEAETAQLLAALLPAGGREPLFHLRPEREPAGYALEAVHGESGNRVVGRLADFDPEVARLLHVGQYLARTPAALAAVARAAGPLALAMVGRILWAELGGEPDAADPGGDATAADPGGDANLERPPVPGHGNGAG